MAEAMIDQLVVDADRRRPDVFADIEAAPNLRISSISHDSRLAVAGSLFCAIRGGASDGHDYIDEAVEHGAVAVVAERVETAAVPTVLAADSRLACAMLAAAFYGHPTEQVDAAAVTGTNGKTTIVTMLAHVAEFAGVSSAALGTLTGSLTTPSAVEFQQQIREHVDDGAQLIGVEVSSHALDQDRVAGSSFAVAVFSNLSQDHLDYHGDMESYFAAKAKLFSGDLAKVAIVDMSTDYGRRIAALATIPVIEVETASATAKATSDSGSTSFLWRDQELRLPMWGRFNVANALLVAETASELGIGEQAIRDALECVPQVPGRFEVIDAGQPFVVVVDYSHTPASLEAAIGTARDIARCRVLAVFGAAGDRDRGKRPLMGKAAEGADVLFVTSDNPRSEDPEQIIDDVIAGTGRSGVRRDSDRRAAIGAAIGEAGPGDVVLVAGKGHEDYQIVGSTRFDFDDRQVSREALAALGWEIR